MYRLAAEADLEASRGKPTVAELDNLADDIAESRDLAAARSDMARKLRGEFDKLIARGASRPGVQGKNDGVVRYDITQTVRWIPAAN